MSADIDDEELTFDDNPPAAAPDAGAEPEPAPSKAPETAQAQPAAAAEPAPKQDAGPAAPPKKRSNVGMAVAAGFAICSVASVTSAVQASRAASAANGSAASSPDALAARLNKIEKLLEQQRNRSEEHTSELQSLMRNP